MQPRPIALAMTVLAAASQAAPAPVLSPSPPTICKPGAYNDWLPATAQVEQLEQALSTYFEKPPLADRQLPARGQVYDRQYRGLMRDGRKMIYGSFYPVGRFRDDECLIVSADGGNQLWYLWFDAQDGQIVQFHIGGR